MVKLFGNQIYILKKAKNIQLPVIFSSPHSGSFYTSEFLASSGLDLIGLRSSEDAFVNELYDCVPKFGAFFLSAVYPRSWVDLNRSPEELDFRIIKGAPRVRLTSKTSAGFGVIPRYTGSGNRIQNTMLTMEKAKMRLNQFYFPYHNCLSHLIKKIHANYGSVLVFDCHSMPSVINLNIRGSDPGPDIVLGDCYGKSCHADLINFVEECFQRHDLKVDRNEPFSGGYITDHYGRPSENIHVIQIEINRSLYMNEKLITHNSNFDQFKEKISSVCQNLTNTSVVNLLQDT